LRQPGPFPGIGDFLGLALLAAAVLGEAAADAQLARFARDNSGRKAVCDVGLWAWSRHPNYFFEWLFWCAWPLLSLSSSVSTFASLLAPALMYWLLVHVSGIPPLEDHMLRTRGDKFRILQRRVNAFFPGPRRNGELP